MRRNSPYLCAFVPGRVEGILIDDHDAIERQNAKLEMIDHRAPMVVRCVLHERSPTTSWTKHCYARVKTLAAAIRLDAAADHRPALAYVPRDREMRMDMVTNRQAS